MAEDQARRREFRPQPRWGQWVALVGIVLTLLSRVLPVISGGPVRAASVVSTAVVVVLTGIAVRQLRVRVFIDGDGVEYVGYLRRCKLAWSDIRSARVTFWRITVERRHGQPVLLLNFGRGLGFAAHRRIAAEITRLVAAYEARPRRESRDWNSLDRCPGEADREARTPDQREVLWALRDSAEEDLTHPLHLFARRFGTATGNVAIKSLLEAGLGEFGYWVGAPRAFTALTEAHLGEVLVEPGARLSRDNSWQLVHKIPGLPPLSSLSVVLTTRGDEALPK